MINKKGFGNILHFLDVAEVTTGQKKDSGAVVGPTKIMFLSTDVRGGGAGWSLYYLLKHLDPHKVEPFVVVPTAGIFEKRFEELGVHVVSLPRMPEWTRQLRFRRNTWLTAATSYGLNLLDSAALVPRLVALIRREGIQLVHCNHGMVKAIGALAAQLAGVSCVLHARTCHERASEVLYYCQGIARLPVVQTVISVSRATAVPYKAAVPHKVHVVYNGIDPGEYRADDIEAGRFRATHGLGRDEIIVGFAGSLIPRKGVETLIKAASRVLSARPDVTFVIAGGVPTHTRTDNRALYEALAADLGLAERIRFVGFLEDVRHAMRDFDLLAMPSMKEPFGRSIIEAMALGTPVVATRVGGIPEIIEDGVDGLLVPAGDEEALAAAIGRLVDDASLRQRLAQAAVSKVRDKFDVAVLTRRIESLLLQAANGSSDIEF